jgi:hypothetical protein
MVHVLRGILAYLLLEPSLLFVLGVCGFVPHRLMEGSAWLPSFFLLLCRYVQCYNCGNPETVIKIRKDLINLKCKACGFVSDVDMRHKLNTYILKNPPEEKVSKAEKKCVAPSSVVPHVFAYALSKLS